MVVTDYCSPTTRKQALAFVVACLGAVSLAGCQKAAGPAAPQMGPPPVAVCKPVVKEVVDYDEFPARLAAVDSVEIRARVSGYLDLVNFKDGAFVKKGDLLFQIDPRPFQAELDRAQANLATAQTQLNLAANDAKRANELMQSKAISAEEFDTRNNRQAVADAAVKIAQAGVETAKLNLDYTRILAPIDGILSRTIITKGNLVVGDGNNSTLLTTLVSISPVYAYADIDEATVIKYQKLDKEGLRKNYNGAIPADLSLGDTNDFSHHGTIDFVDNQIDPTTGTLHIRAVFPNEGRNLIPGQFGRLRITGSAKHQALLIPDYAIGSDQEKKMVYVVGKDNKLMPKIVVPGQLVDGLRVIRSGLEPDDLVVLDRLMIVRPGMPVTPNVQPATPTPSAAPAAPSHS